MVIESIDLFHLTVPTEDAVAGEGQSRASESVLVCMQSGDLCGWGEASPGTAPADRQQWAGGVFAVLSRWFAPAVVGAQVDSAEDLHERLSSFRGNSYARGALDMAWWDLAAKRQNVPLHRLLGGADRSVRLGRSFGQMQSIDELLASIQKAGDEGYRQTTLEFRPGWDLEVVRAVRQVFPSESLRIDCNGGCHIDQTGTFHLLEDFGLDAIEQPLAPTDFVGHAMLQESIRTPLCLDQSIESLADAEMALDLRSAREINLTPDRVGGHFVALAIRDACRRAETVVACCVASDNPTQIGARHALALAVQDGFNEIAQLPSVTVLESVVKQTADGALLAKPSDSPGIGIEPDLKAIEKSSLAACRIE